MPAWTIGRKYYGKNNTDKFDILNPGPGTYKTNFNNRPKSPNWMFFN